MKRTHPKNIAISRHIEEILEVKFTDNEFRLDNWGEADNYCQIGEHTFLFLECECTQRHPNTNVLKYWPFLEERKNRSVILLHYFFPENKAPKNRIALCGYTASKLEELFSSRFHYINLGRDIDRFEEIIDKKKASLKLFKQAKPLIKLN